MERRHAWGGGLGLLFVAMVWGSSYAVTKQALLSYPVLGFIALRFGLTFLCLAPFLRRELRRALPMGIPLGVGLLAIFLCEINGIARTSASNAGFLMALFVVFTPLVEWLLLRRRPAPSMLVACAVSLAGVWLLTRHAGQQWHAGDLLIIAAALLRALLACLTQRLYARWSCSPQALTAVQSGVVTAGCLLLAGIGGGLPPLPASPAFWATMAYLVLFATLLAFAIQNWALHGTSPTQVMLLMGSEPLFGALFAVGLLGERPTPTAWVGGVLIMGAALWPALGARRSSPERP